MLSKCQAIVIHSINYSESSVILKCFTSDYGLQSYMINGVRGRKGAIRSSQLLPLTLLELDTYHQQNKNLQRIKELKCIPVLHHIHFDIIKSSIGMFLAELLNKVLSEENQQDKPLFDFLFNSIQILDLSASNVSNFPCYFMLHLSRFLGFMPKGNYSEMHNSFNKIEGVYDEWFIGAPNQIEPELSEKLFRLQESNFDSFHLIKLNTQQRSELLNILISYYQSHLATFSNLKSHKVLAEVLG